ncbi:MAG: superoxide dismutase [Cu-Zn] SodC2 [Desulfobacca sp.]|nr:superoxide dismutase [Cu-Zn] SodC2 [Desulfobacca sp.]
MKNQIVFLGLFVGLFLSGLAYGEETVVPMFLVTEGGSGKEIGTITASDSPYGMILTPNLRDLTPGLHGFHLHTNPNCGTALKDGKPVPGLAAGGHYDPKGSGKHEGPYGQAHLGDLPALYVNFEGRSTLPVLAPRVKVSDLKRRSLVIHAGGDNYSDLPEPLGGGGSRVACGVVE